MDSEKVSRDNTVMDFKTLNNFEENEDVRLLERLKKVAVEMRKTLEYTSFIKCDSIKVTILN